MKKHLIIFLVLVISISGISQTFAQDKQDKQKNLMGSYIGRWRGNVTGKNINRLGGWDDKFLGYHEIFKEESNLYLDVRFLHPLDDPSTIKQYKKLGYPPETIELYRNMMAVPDELTINGYAILSGISEYTHITREYCEECVGKDGTTRKDFPAVVFPVSGRIDLVENKIEFDFSDMPEEYDKIFFLLGEPKLVAPDKIEFNFKNFEEPNDGVYALEQIAKGELHKVRKCEKKDNIPLDGIVSTEYKDEIKTFPNGTEVRKTHDKLKIVTEDGCVELYLKDYFKIIGSDGTEMEIVISKVLDGIISSELYQGSIQVDIWEGGKHHHFFTRNAIVEVSGTNFTMEVSKDGTTTLTVLDGEVEFSDINKKNTVIVKKNQISVVSPGGLPSKPVSIDPNQIPRWWE